MALALRGCAIAHLGRSHTAFRRPTLRRPGPSVRRTTTTTTASTSTTTPAPTTTRSPPTGPAHRDDDDDTMSVQEYLEKHDLSKKVEEALNAAVKAKAEEPLAFVVRASRARD